MKELKDLKVAFVHEFLTQYGGAERVLEALLEIFPDAPIYTLIYNEEKMGKFFGKYQIKTSFLQKKFMAQQKSRWYLPWMPTATESFDLSEYDLVISDSSAFAKGVITKPDVPHICYCHTPTRYLWSDTIQYLHDANIPWPISKIMPYVITYLRIWDFQAAQRPDFIIANSKYVQDRIKKFYRRDSVVINPFADINKFKPQTKKKDYYLAAGRLTPIKRFDIVVEAFNKLSDKKLYIVGSSIIAGSSVKDNKLEKFAKSKNIEFLGRVSDEKLTELYANAKAFVFPSEEDFGMTPLEAMASATPVIAFGKGGATETVVDKKTGLFFAQQSAASLVDAIKQFEKMKFNSEDIINQAKKFSKEIFKEEMKRYIINCINK